MKACLRLLLITLTVGGGFTGLVLTLQIWLRTQVMGILPHLLLAFSVLLYGFVMVSGLVLAHNPSRVRLVLIALALQVPWISSPLIAYRFSSGFHFTLGMVGWHFTSRFMLGSDWQFNVLQHVQWGVGVNVFALALLLICWRVMKSQRG